MRLTPYVMFNGQCEEAFKFYEQVLGARITFKMTYGEAPASGETPPESSKLIMHSTLAIGDQLLQASDAPPDRYEAPKGIYISISLKDAAEGERIFNALAENGTVHLPFEKTFWAAGFGMCVDRFGIPWMVNCEQES